MPDSLERGSNGNSNAAVGTAVSAFPKKHFPAIHPRRHDAPSRHIPVTMMREPVVRVSNTDISGCCCCVVRGDILRACPRCCLKGRQGCGQGIAQARACAGGKADSRKACETGTGRDRRGRRRGADLDRAVWHLGRLHRGAERQEGLLRTGKAFVIENQSTESSTRSGLGLRLDASGGKGRQRSLDHDRLCAEAGLGILA